MLYIFTRAAHLFDDTSVHVISELLVNLGCLSVNSFVEWVSTSLEPFMEVQARDIRHKADFDYAPNLSHLTKPGIINI